MKKFHAVLVACAALLAGCGRQQATPTEAGKEDQDRITEERQAQEESALHEREAALDERERQLAQQQQAAATSPEPAPPQAPPAAAALAPAATPPPPPAVSPDVSYQAFFDTLTPYGRWYTMAGYGYVWQPAAAQDGLWRPYTLGHWLFTDAGWTWMSDEPFGWITYHYGRWMRLPSLNWVWIPGNLWAPAWVSWRYGQDSVGWAPLPPEARFDAGTGFQQWVDQQYNLGANDYTFVPAADFGDDDMAQDVIPPDQTGAIFDNSNNATNIYYDSGYVICLGPNFDFIQTKVRHHFPPPFRLSRSGFRSDGNNAPTASGGTLHVSAPRIVEPGSTGSGGRVVERRVAATAGSPASTMSPPPGGMRIPSRMHPVPITETNSNTPAAPGPPAAPTDVQYRPPANPSPVNSSAQNQNVQNTQDTRDQQVIKQEQDARAAQVRHDAEIRAAEDARARAAQEQAAREQTARDQAAHEQAARDQAARDQAARDQAAHDQAVHDQAARDQAARQSQAVSAGSPAISGRP